MAKTDIQIQFSDPNPETSISQSESKYNSNNIELKDLTYFMKYHGIIQHKVHPINK